MKKGIRGYVSIFLALVALPVFSIALVGIDISKIILLRSQLRQNNIMFLDSALSYYDKDLYNKYGLFALIVEKEDLNKSLRNIVEKNLYYNEENFFKPRLKDINLIDMENNRLLGDNLLEQIKKHMTYKMPLKVGKGLINLINLSIDQKKYHKVMDEKYSYEEAYSKMNASVEDLGIEFAKYDASFQNINKIISEVGKRVNKLKKDINTLKEEKNKLEDRLAKADKGSIEEKNIRKNIKTTSLKISEMLKLYNEENKKNYREVVILDLSFKKILRLLDGLLDDSKKIDGTISSWKRSLNELEKSDIRDGFSNEINNADRKISGENIKKLVQKLRTHEDSLGKIIDFFRNGNFYEVSFEQDLNKISVSTENLTKLPSLRNYKLYNYLLQNSKMKTVEKKEKKKAKSDRKELNKLKDRASEVSEQKTGASIYDYVDKDTIDRIKDLSSSEKELTLDISGELSGYRSILTTVGNIIPNDLLSRPNLYENLLISEYINDYFSNKIAKLEDGMVNQVEYILLGKSALDKNNKSISNYVLGLRFVLNSLYAFTNPKLLKEATAIAVGISGWTGFAVPLVKSLVLSSMSLGESILDLEKINSGKNLEAFKNNSTWQVSVGGIKKILGSKLSEAGKSAIDNFYEDMVNFTGNSIDKLNLKIDEFIRQTIDGISQQVNSTIITPVQNKVENIINLKVDEIRLELTRLFDEITKNINQEKNKNLLDLKIQAFNLVRSSVENNLLKNMDRFKNDLNFFDDFFSDISRKAEDKITKLTSQASMRFKNEIRDSLKKGAEYGKEKIEDTINKFLGNYSEENGKISYGTYSGLSFNYSDYLRLISFFLLSSGDRDKIIERIGLMVDYNIKKLNSNFDIGKAYVKLKIELRLTANTNIIGNFFKREDILDSVEGGY